MTENAETSAPPKNRSLAWILVPAILVLVACLAFLAIRFATADLRVPNFTRTEFDAAWKKWQNAAPADYRIKTVVEGPQPAEYEVTVREGQVVSATRNGQPLTQYRTQGTWSVPGMFDTIESDIETTEQPQPMLKLSLRCEFDEQYGIPRRYLRNDYTSKTHTQWEVVKFEPSGTTVISGDRRPIPMNPVSYTHLTLPTICSV